MGSSLIDVVYENLCSTYKQQIKEPGGTLILPLEEHARTMNMSPSALRIAIVKLRESGRIVAEKKSYPVYMPEHWQISFPQAQS